MISRFWSETPTESAKLPKRIKSDSDFGSSMKATAGRQRHVHLIASTGRPLMKGKMMAYELSGGASDGIGLKATNGSDARGDLATVVVALSAGYDGGGD
jgi:hypothetical protein